MHPFGRPPYERFVPEEASTGQLLQAVARGDRERMRRFAESIGMQRAFHPILLLLSRREGQTQGELAQALGLTAPTISVTLRRMEEAGFIQRRADEKDQRQLRIFPTEKAAGMERLARENQKRLDTVLTAALSAEEAAELRRLLLKILDSIPQGGER